ncbi:M10 family metallopeptidase C-terminal domain-containing protein [Microvirga pakistanensis]|uniref:M10 family metallopeptidase C-terminal domain-containing protein n=1 Tax=Microvirga pakistanensis TaxID=1682650 RepID=UPI00106AC991|nr:M10 family metallopeptidase C-terminal domain-containing protein [Microvirga pakistanensis]
MSRIKQITKTGNPLVDGVFTAGNVWDMSDGPVKVKIGTANGHNGDGGWFEAVDVKGRDVFDPDALARNGSDTQPWTLSDEQALMQAAQSLEAFCGVKFESTSSFEGADVVWWRVYGGRFVDLDIPGSFEHEAPVEPITGQQQSWGYLVNLHDGFQSYVPGGLGFQTILGLAAQAVGLNWAHEEGMPGVDSPYDKGDFGFNASPYTLMSVNKLPPNHSFYGNYGFLKTPSAIDVAALQAMYGANMTTATGNNQYVLPTANVQGTGWTTIWDAGGIDTISAAYSTLPVSINLNQASLNVGDPNAAGYFSRQMNVYGGFTIAKGTVIENATGGKGNDLIVGNAYANVIKGGLGNDTLKGLGGRDTFVFSSKPNSKTNIDKILDYSVASDTIQLAKASFSKIVTKKGALKSNEFWKGTKAHDRDDHIIYDTKSGALYYDPDGTGSAAAIKFATIGKNLKMSAAEFVII